MDLTCQLIEGLFPRYEDIVPKGHNLRTVVDVAEFIQAVKVARMFAKHELEIVQLSIVESKPMVVMAETAEMGDVTTEVDSTVVFRNGDVDPDILLAFNGAYLLQALDVMGSGRVAIETTMAHSPAVLRPEPGDGASFCHVIMPMSIRNQ